MSYLKFFQKFLKHAAGENGLDLSSEGDLIDWYKKASTYVEDFMKYEPNANQSSVTQALLMGGLSLKLGPESMAAAFYVGYQLAIKSLFTSSLKSSHRLEDGLFSYCVTESAGNGPKHIASTLQPFGKGEWLLSGVKTFVTAPDIATDYLVVASTGWNKEQNQLRMLHLEKTVLETDASVGLNVFPALPFLTKIRHGSLSFKGFLVKDSQVLEGDAYSKYVKPFRWYEDVHVFSAIFGMLSCAAFKANNDSLLSQMLVLSSSINGLSCSGSYVDYLQFAGLKSLFVEMDKPISSVLREIDPELAEMWQRDRKLFDIANGARSKRAEIAWKQFQAT